MKQFFRQSCSLQYLNQESSAMEENAPSSPSKEKLFSRQNLKEILVESTDTKKRTMDRQSEAADRQMTKEQKILSFELRRHNETINRLIFQPNSINTQNPIVRPEKIAQLLKEYIIDNSKRKALFDEIADEIAAKLKEKCNQIVTDMKQQERRQYQLTTKLHKQKYQQMKEKKSKNIPVAKRVESLERLPINIETAVRLDILSCFLRSNQVYSEQYGHNLDSVMVTFPTLSRLLQFQTEDILKYRNRYRQTWQWVSFEYEEAFHQFIAIASIIQIKQKSEKKCSRPYKSDKSDKQDSYDDYERRYKYRFSQIVFLPNGSSIDKCTTIKRTQVIVQLRRLFTLENYFDQKKIFLDIRIHYGASFQEMHAYLKELEERPQVIEQKYRKQIQIHDNLQNIKWYFLLQSTLSVQKALRHLTKDHYNWRQIYQQKYYKQLFNLFAKERMSFYAETLSLHLRYHALATKCKFLYICRFQYSFLGLKKQFEDNFKEENAQDQTGTLIICTLHDRVILLSFIRRVITDDMLGTFIKNALINEHINIQQSFHLILKQLSMKKGSYSWKNIRKFRSPIYEKFKAFVYISNDVKLFQIHHIIDANMLNWFKKNSSSINSQNFYEKIQQKISQTASAVSLITFNFKTMPDNFSQQGLSYESQLGALKKVLSARYSQERRKFLQFSSENQLKQEIVGFIHHGKIEKHRLSIRQQ